MTMAPVLKKSEVKKVLEELCALFDDRSVQEADEEFSCSTCVKLILELKYHVQNPTHNNLRQGKVDVPFGGKDEDKEWLERADHPLLNDVILKRVFGHVRRFDLKACRGVSKKWNEHTLPHMRSTFTVTIHGSKSDNERRIVDFVKLFKSNELGIPFEKYRLGPFRTTDGAGKQFLDICGESIKAIVLFQPYPVQYVRTIENLSELLKFSPKLETLTISGQFVSRSRNVVKLFPDSTPVLSSLKKLTVNHDSRKSPVKYCPTFFDELLSVALNVSDITIDDMSCLTQPKSGITVVLNSIEELGRESSIQSLSLESMSLQHVEILKRMAENPNGLKLKEINFYAEENLDSNVDIRLATIFKDTLEGFSGSCESAGINLMDFPRMPKLKSCEFRINLDLGFTPVNLNLMFPVIETLNVSYNYTTNHGSDSVVFFSHFEECPTITTLIVDGDVTSIPAFRNILRVFKNLRKLTLFLEGEDVGQVLRQIWANMTQLESLSLDVRNGSRDATKLDSLFTGIPIEGLNQIRHVIADLEKMTVEERRVTIWTLVENHGNHQEPSIRNLTNLKHLTLYVNRGREWSDNLSDLAGYLGLYMMKRLTYLSIQRCEFTKTCCEILTKETGLDAWRFNTEGFVHIIPPFQNSILLN